MIKNSGNNAGCLRVKNRIFVGIQDIFYKNYWTNRDFSVENIKKALYKLKIKKIYSL